MALCTINPAFQRRSRWDPGWRFEDRTPTQRENHGSPQIWWHHAQDVEIEFCSMQLNCLRKGAAALASLLANPNTSDRCLLISLHSISNCPQKSMQSRHVSLRTDSAWWDPEGSWIMEYLPRGGPRGLTITPNFLEDTVTFPATVDFNPILSGKVGILVYGTEWIQACCRTSGTPSGMVVLWNSGDLSRDSSLPNDLARTDEATGRRDMTGEVLVPKLTPTQRVRDIHTTTSSRPK
ncbi:hypothetical protein EV356DRAFT_513599 [Viridothelium virens]|uniref:Uncharacterized protein n=1 Tax=Viridothelium virens TaxID=1048519 RepID=A0A6A6HCW9_VIRVR|nr:hypothetical protein EV356DRAFT_513599 [Viridothelium virens]